MSYPMSGPSSTHFKLITNNKVRTNFNPPTVNVKKRGWLSGFHSEWLDFSSWSTPKETKRSVYS